MVEVRQVRQLRLVEGFDGRQLTVPERLVEGLDQQGVALVVSQIGSAMFGTPRIPARVVAHPRHSIGYGCGSLRAIGARRRASASTQTYLTDY